jgi:hypothetical protein
MNIRKPWITLAILVVSGLGIAVVGPSAQAIQVQKTDQCGISGLVHSEQQVVGGVQGGNFGQAVGGYNGNAHGSGSFAGSTQAAHDAQKSAATGCSHNPP